MSSKKSKRSKSKRSKRAAIELERVRWWAMGPVFPGFVPVLFEFPSSVGGAAVERKPHLEGAGLGGMVS